MMHMLRITQCRDPLMWYSGLIGELVPFCGQWREAYKSLEPSGFLNRVEFADAEIVTLNADGTVTPVQKDRKQMKAQVERLERQLKEMNAIIYGVTAISHYGGWGRMSEADCLIAIRNATLQFVKYCNTRDKAFNSMNEMYEQQDIKQQFPAHIATFTLAIRSNTGYRSITEGRCTPEQYGAALAALEGYREEALLKARQEEREACALLCEEAIQGISEGVVIGKTRRSVGINVCTNLAARIRARGDKS
jgi:hypothetical protein